MSGDPANEFARLQSTFNSLVNEIRHSSHQRLQQHDVETSVPGNTTAGNTLEMPGAFPFETRNTTDPSVQREPPSGPTVGPLSNLFSSGSLTSKVLLVIFITVLIVLMLPVYIFTRILIYVFFVVVAIAIKFKKMKYKPLPSNDPTDVSRRFIARFDDRIGNKNKLMSDAEMESSSGDLVGESHLAELERPDFLECAYSHALYILQKDARWLLCYVESNDNPESIEFTKDVLINKQFLSFIRDRDILVWGGDISESEAFLAANQFNITKLPFLGLLCLTVNQIQTSSGTQDTEPVLSLVAKIQGYKSLSATLKKLDKAYQKYDPVVRRLRSRGANNLQSVMRSLQGEAYDNSLRRNHFQRQQMEQRERETQQEIDAKRSQWLQWRKSLLAPPCTESGEYARIAVKLPNGERQMYTVDKTCSLEEIYALVECNAMNDVVIDNSRTYEQPSNYTHEYSFKVYTVLPRELLPSQTDVSIADTPSIYPSGSLIVEMNH